MRVVHLACVAPPQIGGIGQAAYEEVVGLRAQGVEAELVTTQNGDKEASIRRLPSCIRIGNAAWVKGWKDVIKSADVVHLHYPWYGVAERVLWRRLSMPVVMTFHMDAVAIDWRGVVFAAHRRWLQPRLMSNASKIIVSSLDYAERSSLARHWSELQHKIVEIPYGIDTDFFCPESSRLSLSTGQLILFVGGLDRAHSFKGLEVLLEAMAGLVDAKLTIVGEGDRRGYFEERVRELGLSQRVTFFGRVSREALREAYRAADVLAFPSTSSAEAFGLVAAEAQACGVPVVASRFPGVREVVRDGVTGILVEPGSVSDLRAGLQSLQNDTERRLRYGRAAREHVLDRFSRAKHGERLLRVYQDLRV